MPFIGTKRKPSFTNSAHKYVSCIYLISSLNLCPSNTILGIRREHPLIELEKKKEEYKTLLYNLEESNIRDFKEELKTIKDLEVLNGEREGKKRKFFPKGSPEYLRKQELKAQIDKYKEENLEYKNAYREYKAIESSLANSIVATL